MYDKIKEEHNPKEEYEFEEQAKVFLSSYGAMQNKYQQLLMKQSQVRQIETSTNKPKIYICKLQQQAPTSELMMLDRLRVADLKDEIVSMQSELNNVLFEQHQKSQMTIKNETVATPQQLNLSYQHQVPQVSPIQTPNQQIQPVVIQTSQSNSRAPIVSIMQEPSQILKAKQEQKLYESIKNDRVKIEVPELQKETIKTSYGHLPSPTALIPCHVSPSPIQPQKQSKFDKLKNESLNIVVNTHHAPSNSQPPMTQILSPNMNKSSHLSVKPTMELKQELDDFDIESEIRPNLIMKKCESIPSPGISHNVTSKKQSKPKEKEREFSPLSDYFNTKVLPKNNKNENVKNETNDSSYDEWLNLQLSVPNSNMACNKKKDGAAKCIKNQAKMLENDLSEIFEHHTSPKSVEKQLDDLFSTSNKSSDMLATASPLTEFFHSETSNINEKSVENRLEALFGTSEDDSRKSNQQDLVETRLEQLFQGSVAENDESALDNASFLYKNTDMTYDMIQKQIHVSTSSVDNENGNSSNANKRQWSGACDMFASTNSSILFPAPSSPSSKRACTAAPSVAFDNKWIEDSFDFASEIMSTESSGDDITKHQSWNGNLDHRETMIGGIQSPHQSQFHLPSSDVSNIQQIQNPAQNLQQTEPHLNLMERQEQMMGTQISNLNYDDVDDISRQVQNAIDSILNLQSSDPLHYQLDSSFLELNTITDPSGSPSSPVNLQQSHALQNQNPQQINQYQMHPRSENQIHSHHGFNNQKSLNMPKRKYSRMDDIGDCLIGGSNLDDSPSGLALPEAHGVDSSSACVGEFVNNLLSCEEKSITTSWQVSIEFSSTSMWSEGIETRRELKKSENVTEDVEEYFTF